MSSLVRRRVTQLLIKNRHSGDDIKLSEFICSVCKTCNRIDARGMER